jgi:T5SS/PEP-CTERM-associated repeat protein
MFITNSGGTVDISGLTTLGMTAGSIEGAGTYNLGSKALTVGLNNHSTTVSGPITGANAGGSGSLIKIGTGTLTDRNEPCQNTIVDGGALTIQNGGKVSNVNGTLGAVAGTTGTISVIGPGSTWINSGGVGVGGSGTGTLNILNGGTVSDNNGTLGASPGSTGTVTVDGAGSIWANLSNLSVGSAGTGTMNITNGGLVTDAVGEPGQRARWYSNSGRRALDLTNSGVSVLAAFDSRRVEPVF